MDKEKIKLIVRNLELLVDSLKAEIYSDERTQQSYETKSIANSITDYDEIFEDYND